MTKTIICPKCKFEFVPAAENAFKPWTESEDKILMQRKNEGVTESTIGLELGRTHDAVHERWRKITSGDAEASSSKKMLVKRSEYAALKESYEKIYGICRKLVGAKLYEQRKIIKELKSIVGGV